MRECSLRSGKGLSARFPHPALPAYLALLPLGSDCVLIFLKEHFKVVKRGDSPLHLGTMEPGATYCVKARARVNAIGRHSAFSQTRCVKMQGKGNLPVPGSLHLAALPMVPGFPWIYVFASRVGGF